MRHSVIRRIAQLEVRTAARQWRVVFRMGPLNQLPPEYTGERHVVAERCPCPEPKDHEYCRFEERPGPAPAGAVDSAFDAKSGTQRIDIHVVRSPSDSESEEQHWAELTASCAGRPQ